MPRNRYNYDFHLIQRLFVLNTLNFLTDLKSSSCSFGTWATSSRRSWKFLHQIYDFCLAASTLTLLIILWKILLQRQVMCLFNIKHNDLNMFNILTWSRLSEQIAFQCVLFCFRLKKKLFFLFNVFPHTFKALHHWKYYLSFILDQRSSLNISTCLVGHLEIQNNCNCANSKSSFRVRALCCCWKERYLHDKFLVIAVDEVEDVEVNSSAKVIWKLEKNCHFAKE